MPTRLHILVLAAALTLVPAIASAATATLYPDGDVANAGTAPNQWLNSAGTPVSAPLWSYIDDDTSTAGGDGDYMQTGSAPSDAQASFTMSNAAGGTLGVSQMVLSVRMLKAVGTRDFTIQLFYTTDGSAPSTSSTSAGAAVTQTAAAVTRTSFTVSSLTLSETQINNLRVLVRVIQVSTGTAVTPRLTALDCVITTVATTTWNNGSGTNVWGTAGNWSNGVPTSGTVATFNGTSTTACAINVDAIAFGVTIASAYSGTITQNPGFSLTVGINGLSQAGGTFTGASAGAASERISVSGSFALSGVTFTSTRSTLSVSGDFTVSGGTFAHNSGTVVLCPASTCTLTSTQSFHHLTLSDGLVAHYDFEDSASPAVDQTGRGHNATWQGSPTPSTTVKPTLEVTNARAMSLVSASSQYLVPANQADFSLPQLTISVWAYATAFTNGRSVFNKQAVGIDPDSGSSIETNGTGYTFYLYIAGALRSVSTAALSTSTWYHLTGTYDGTTMRLYLNGVSTGTPVSVSGSASYPTGGLTGIGRNEYTPTNFFPGTIDELRIYDRAIDTTSITRLAAGRNPLTSAVTFTQATSIDVDGNLTISGGTLTPGAFNATVGGSWLNLGGTFTAGAGSVTLDGVGQTGRTIRSNGSAFTTLAVSGSGSDWTMVDQITASGYAQSNGTVTQQSSSLALICGASGYTQTGGTFTLLGQVVTPIFNQSAGSFSGGTVTVVSSTSQNFCAASTLTNLTFEAPGEYGLLGYWKMDGSSTTTELDASGNGHDATLVNGVASSTATGTTSFHNTGSRTCIGSPTYASSATRRFMTVADHADFNTSGPFTVCGWFRVSDTGSQNYLVMHGDLSTNGFILKVGAGAGFNAAFTIFSSALGSTQSNVSGVIISPATWYHLTGVYDGTSVILYKNGTAVGPVPRAAGMDSAAGSPVYLGGDGGANTVNGELDDIRFYNRALSASEVAALAGGLYGPGRSGAATFTLTRALAVSDNLTVFSGGIDVGAANYAVSVGKNLKLYGDLNARAGTVTLTGTASSTLHSGGNRFATLSVASTGAGTWTLDDPLWVDTQLSVSAGTLDVSASSHVVRAGTIVQSGGAITPQSGTVVIDGTSSATLTVTSTLKHLQIADPVETGLIAFWPFDAGAGSVARDRAGSNTGTLIGGANWSTTVPSLVATQNGFSLSLDGVEDHVAVPDAAALDVGSFALSAWIRPSTFASGDKDIISKWGAAGARSYGLRVAATTGYLIGDVSTDGTASISTANGTALSVDTWYHVALTCDGATLSTWINGELNGTATTTGSAFASTSSVFIGRFDPSVAAGRYFKGRIDDVRIYSSALSTTRIKLLASGYHAGNGGSTHTLGGALAVGGDLTLIGGVLGAGTAAIGLTGDWRNCLGESAFSGGSGTVTLAATNPTQTLYGSTIFNAFTKNVTSAATLRFAAYECQTFAGALTLNGASGQLLSIASTTTGVSATVKPSGTRTCTFLSVRDSRNFIQPVINPTSSTDLGNTRWWFGRGVGSGNIGAGVPHAY